jgi:hypothetical protein
VISSLLKNKGRFYLSKKIEQAAIEAVDFYFYYSEIIETELSKNDKSPTWDGFLCLYNKKVAPTKDHKKGNLHQKIRTQVKGKQVKEFSEKGKYSFERVDLLNYYNHGGTVVFFVEIKYKDEEKENNTETKVFYKLLLPYDLKKMLDRKEKNKYITVYLDSIEKYELSIIESQLFEFVYDSKQQSVKQDRELSFDEAEEKTINFVLPKSFNPRSLLGRESFIYGKRNKEETVPVVVGKAIITEIETTEKIKITTDGELFFDHIDFVYKEQKTELILGNCFRVKLFENSLNFSIMKDLTLDKQILAGNFLLKILKKRYLEINGIKSNVENVNLNEEELKKSVTYRESAAKIFNLYKIDIKKTKLNDLTKEDMKTLNFLIDALLNKNLFQSNNNISQKVSVLLLKKNILLVKILLSSNECKYINFEDLEYKNIEISNGNISYSASHYFYLTSEDMIKNKNINSKNFYDSITKNGYNSLISGYTTTFILNLIHVYDKNNEKEYLDIAQKLCDWLIKNDETIVAAKINRYQILKRKNELKPRDYIEINDLRKLDNKDNDENKDILNCCINILIDDFNGFEKSFEVLNMDQRKKIKGYPIYTLYKNWYLKHKIIKKSIQHQN